MQHDLKSVLYSTDLSQNTLIAFGYAAYLAKLTGADIHLLHVIEPLSDDAMFTLQTYLQDSRKRHEIIDATGWTSGKRLSGPLRATRTARSAIRSSRSRSANPIRPKRSSRRSRSTTAISS